MKHFVTCTYDHGIQSDKDEKARQLAKNVGGEFVGSGCFLSEKAQRDLEFEVPSKAQADKLSKALKAAGFENVEYNTDDE